MPRSEFPAKPIVHDKALFDLLMETARRIDPEIRTGSMFGCPAIYHGRRMATCVYGNDIGLRVPKDVAFENVSAGRAALFQPYGKPAMKEWIKLEGGAADLASKRDLIAAALAFAEVNNA
jgi:hypothetical protein